jgi:hypothetical protein
VKNKIPDLSKALPHMQVMTGVDESQWPEPPERERSIKRKRKYTERELREIFENWVRTNWSPRYRKRALKREEHGYKSSTVNDQWAGFFIACKRLGVLSEAHKGETDK